MVLRERRGCGRGMRSERNINWFSATPCSLRHRMMMHNILFSTNNFSFAETPKYVSATFNRDIFFFYCDKMKHLGEFFFTDTNRRLEFIF